MSVVGGGESPILGPQSVTGVWPKTCLESVFKGYA